MTVSRGNSKFFSKQEFVMGAFVSDYSGIGSLGIDGIRVLLGAIPFWE